MRLLSKSQFIEGLQCDKALWFSINNPSLFASLKDKEQSTLQTGIDVGDCAKRLFPDGIEVLYASNSAVMAKRTEQLMNEGNEIIYEAAFQTDGLFIMADIFRKTDDGWEIYEVKSSTHVEEYQVNDLAFQWYVLSQSGIPLSKAHIIHLNSEYVRKGALDISELFTVVELTDEIKDKQSFIDYNQRHIKAMLEDSEPNIDIGLQCSDPFDCKYMEYCWRDIPHPSIFNLYRMNKKKKFALYNQGILEYKDLPFETKLTPNQQLQIDTYTSQEPHIDTAIITSFLDEITYPISFFDFETYQDAIPRFDDQRPYQQMPFQYSLHIVYEDGRMEHREFLGDGDTEPRRSLCEQMLDDIPTNGSIIAFNQSFEITRIKELANTFDDLHDDLLALNDRFIDLLIPFRDGGYHHPDFHGSFSIKSVLPAMFPNDSELDYKQLDIQHGGMAMDIYATLHLIEDEEEADMIKTQLLAYCHLDTLAMVRIWEKLHDIAKKS